MSTMPLPPDLLAKLELLRVATRRAQPGRFSARTRSKRLGAGIDFADHRPYTPGDDLKLVDWTLYGRMDQLMVRLSEEETELNVHLLVDLSRSMDLTVGPGKEDHKSLVARYAATAIAYVALSNLDQVRVWPFSSRLAHPLVPSRQRHEILGVWRYLQGVDLPPDTDVAGVVRAFLHSRPARGVVFLISDLPDTGYQRALDQLLHERYDVALVHITSPGELSLPLKGERFDLVDGETGLVLPNVSRGEVALMRRRLQEDRAAVAGWARSRGVPLAQVLTGNPSELEALVLDVFRRKRLLR